MDMNIKGADDGLVREARAAALAKGVTLKEWVLGAMREKLGVVVTKVTKKPKRVGAVVEGDGEADVKVVETRSEHDDGVTRYCPVCEKKLTSWGPETWLCQGGCGRKWSKAELGK